MKNNTKYSLDILIPTRDRPVELSAMLASLGAQDFHEVTGCINLYILDNGITTVTIHHNVARHLDALELRGVRTHYMRRPNARGIFWIRRELYLTSSGTVVCYLDDDILLGPHVIEMLWSGITDLSLNLASGFLLDVDGLHHETITYSGHELLKTTDWLIARLESGQVQVIDKIWMEMMEPTGGTLMFRRSDFDSLGAWERMCPHFEVEPKGWAEDTGLCVALKSLGSAFVAINEFVIHFSPLKRYFAGFEPSEAFKEFLKQNYGADYPDQIAANHHRASFEVAGAINTLREHLHRTRMKR